MAKMPIFKSKIFVTDKVPAVFPHLNEPDRYGNYSIDVDVLSDPAFEETVQKLGEQTMAEAKAKLGVDNDPQKTEFARVGDYEGQPWRRIGFKMKSQREIKGEIVEFRPRIFDAKRAPMGETIYGGSVCRIAYYIQYAVTPTGTFLSLRLDSVQVIDHVGPGGTVSAEKLFDEEDGFETTGTEQAPPTITDVVHTDADSTDTDAPKVSGANF